MRGRPTYAEAVRWIAHNDDLPDDEEDVSGLLTVGLVADLFGKASEEVAHDCKTLDAAIRAEEDR